MSPRALATARYLGTLVVGVAVHVVRADAEPLPSPTDLAAAREDASADVNDSTRTDEPTSVSIEVTTPRFRPELHVELGGGAGGNVARSGAADAPTSYALATASLSASMSRPAPHVMRRGLALCGPATPEKRGTDTVEEERHTDVEVSADTPPSVMLRAGTGSDNQPDDTDREIDGCLWIFTGLGRDVEEGAGVRLSGDVLLGHPRDLASTPSAPSDASSLQVGSEAWGAFMGWRVAGQLNIQPRGSLRDPFWRSGRGIYERRSRFDIPGMWSIGGRNVQAEMMPGHVDLGWRTAYGASGQRHAGFDRDLGLSAVRVHHPRATIDLLEMRLVDYGIDGARREMTTFGTQTSVFDIGARAEVRVTDELALRGQGGATMAAPLAPFERTGNSEHVYVNPTTRPIGWAELEYTSERDTGPDRTARLTSITVAGGLWTRIAPGGHAVDHGHLGTASFRLAHRRLALEGELSLGKLRRILLGSYAPADTAPVGTQLWLGRASVAASLTLAKNLRVRASSWVERSDRDDARWAPATTSDGTALLATRAGADLSASWRFQARRTPSGGYAFLR